MAEPKYRNVKWKSGEVAGIVDCPLGKTIMEHIGCPYFGGMRDKDKREQAVPQQYLGNGNVKRVTNVGCLYVAPVKAKKDAAKGEVVEPAKVDTNDVGEAVAVNGVAVVEEKETVGPQVGDGTSEEVGGRIVQKTDDVGNPIEEPVMVPVEPVKPLKCDCGPNEWCNVCKGKMGKPDGSGKATPQADPPPQTPEIGADVNGEAEAADKRREARGAAPGEEGPEPAQTTKEKDLASQIESAKKKGKGKGKKKGKKSGKRP